MSLSLIVGPLSFDQLTTAMQALANAGIDIGLTGQAPPAQPAPTPTPTPTPTMAPPPQAARPAMPPMPGQPAVPPPPQPAQAAPQQNPKLANVLQLMDAYSRAGHNVAGARKVLGVLGLSRAQDANEEQLDWLAQAFANHSYVP